MSTSQRSLAILIGMTFWASGSPVSTLAATPVSPDEALAWVRHTVPLPQRIEIPAKVTVPANGVQVAVTARHEPLVREAARELRAVLGQEGTGVPAGPTRFTVRLQLGGPEATVLTSLANADQAYRILPGGDEDSLLLVAQNPRGLYYAAKTLQQLIKAHTSQGQVDIPLAEVTDWPDLVDRGLWGGDCQNHVAWLADRKMNRLETIGSVTVDEEGRGHGKYKGAEPSPAAGAPLMGFDSVPEIVHMERQGPRVFPRFPQLKGQGDNVHPGAICYSQPEFPEIMADWMTDLACLPEVTEINVWMTENLVKKTGCQCERCRQEDRSILEARAILKAWQIACERVGHFDLRVLTSEQTEDSNRELFRFYPDEVKVWYYHSLWTYNTQEAPVLQGYLADETARGRRMGLCCNLSAAVSFPLPFTGAEFIRYRMSEIAEKGLNGLLGYSTPGIDFCRFNTEAAAEWTWNVRGRSTREFALSWAVREGIKDPELFAKWSEVHGPVAWDVYGSAWPADEKRTGLGRTADQLKEGTLPEIGVALWEVYPKPWGDIKSVDQLKRNVVQAQKALELARQIGQPEFIEESYVVKAFMDSLEALWELKQVVKSGGIAPENKTKAERAFRQYNASLADACDHLAKWERVVGSGSKRTGKTIELVTRMIDEMIEVASGFGIRTVQP